MWALNGSAATSRTANTRIFLAKGARQKIEMISIWNHSNLSGW
jgi:hypothetical protein